MSNQIPDKEEAVGKALVSAEPVTELTLLSPARLRILSEQRKLFLDFVKSQMINQVDYGRFGKANKDSLLKAGAEKLCRLYGLGHRIVKEEDVIDRENNFVLCSRTVAVYSLKTDQVLSEGQGSMNSEERKDLKLNPLGSINNLQKMAWKRAFVAAVISATSASEIFTQDFEDAEDERAQKKVEQYRIPVGSIRGKTFDEVHPADLAGCVVEAEKWVSSAEAKNKPEHVRDCISDFITRAKVELSKKSDEDPAKGIFEP